MSWPHDFSEWPKVIDGKTLWACCVSEIGPECGHMADPCDRPVFVQGHMHSEPVCAWPDCKTYLTRAQMGELANN